MDVQLAASSPELETVLALLLEGAKSNDWNTRNASAEAFSHLTKIFEDHPSVFSPFIQEILKSLELIRYDKV